MQIEGDSKESNKKAGREILDDMLRAKADERALESRENSDPPSKLSDLRVPALRPASEVLRSEESKQNKIESGFGLAISDLGSRCENMGILPKRVLRELNLVAGSDQAELFQTLCESSEIFQKIKTFDKFYGEVSALKERVELVGAAYVFAELSLRDPVLAEEIAQKLLRNEKFDRFEMEQLEDFYLKNCFVSSLTSRLTSDEDQQVFSSTERVFLKGALHPYFELQESSKQTLWRRLVDGGHGANDTYQIIKGSPLTNVEHQFLLTLGDQGSENWIDTPSAGPNVRAELAEIFEESSISQAILLKELELFLAREPELNDDELYFILESTRNLSYTSVDAIREVILEVNKVEGQKHFELGVAPAYSASLSPALCMYFEALRCVNSIRDPKQWQVAQSTYKEVISKSGGDASQDFLKGVCESLQKLHISRFEEIAPEKYYELNPNKRPPEIPEGVHKGMREVFLQHYEDKKALIGRIETFLLSKPALSEIDLEFLVDQLSILEISDTKTNTKLSSLIDETLGTWHERNSNYLTSNCYVYLEALSCLAEIKDINNFDRAYRKLLSFRNQPQNQAQVSVDLLDDYTETLKIHAQNVLRRLQPEEFSKRFPAPQYPSDLHSGIQSVFEKHYDQEIVLLIELERFLLSAPKLTEIDVAFLARELKDSEIVSDQANTDAIDLINDCLKLGVSGAGKLTPAAVIFIRMFDCVETISDVDLYQSTLSDITAICDLYVNRSRAGKMLDGLERCLRAQHAQRLNHLLPDKFEATYGNRRVELPHNVPTVLSPILVKIIEDEEIGLSEALKRIDQFLETKPALNEKDLDYIVTSFKNSNWRSPYADAEVVTAVRTWMRASFSTSGDGSETIALYMKALECVERIHDDAQFKAVLPKMKRALDKTSDYWTSEFIESVRVTLERMHAKVLKSCTE